MDRLRNSKRGQIGLAVALVLVIGLGGWFLLVKPKKSHAQDLSVQITTAESELATRKQELSKPYAAVQVKAADLYRLTRALPDHADMPGIMLQLERLARGNKVTLEGVVPNALVANAGLDEQPLSVKVQGRYTNVSKFVGALQRLTRVKNKRLDSTGRLYVVKSVRLGEATGVGFPFVSADLGVSAYAFTGSSTTTTPGTTPDQTTSTTTPTTTPSTTTTTPTAPPPSASPSGSTSAAGATP
jgi:hypothetical protein